MISRVGFRPNIMALTKTKEFKLLITKYQNHGPSALQVPFSRLQPTNQPIKYFLLGVASFWPLFYSDHIGEGAEVVIRLVSFSLSREKLWTSDRVTFSSQSPSWLKPLSPNPAGPGSCKLFPFSDDAGHFALSDLQSYRNLSVAISSPDFCLQTIPSLMSTDNLLELMFGLCSDIYGNLGT